MKRHVQGSFGIVDEVAHNRVVLAKHPVAGDEPEDFVGEAGHGSESFHFLIGQAGRLKNGALDDLVGVADECSAGLRAALDGVLDALRDGHFSNALDQSLTFCGVGFRRGCGICQRGLVNGMSRPMKFVELIFLFRRQGSGALESRGEGGGSADAVEVLQQELDSARRKMTHGVQEMICGAIFILDQCVTDARLVGQAPGGIGK